MTQPTRGLGVVVNNPRRASASAHVINSRSPGTDVSLDDTKALARLSPRRRGLDFLQRIPEIGDVLEAAVNRRKANVGDLVELVELLHHHLADLARGNLALAQSEHLLHDALDSLVDVLGGHRPFVQCALEAVANAGGIEIGAGSILLDDLRKTQLRRLVGGESLLAGKAAPPSPYGVACFRDARIDDLRVGTAAEGAFHVTSDVRGQMPDV